MELLPSPINVPPTLITLLGTAIAFFLGFNNNPAYDRWWKAGIIWGALVNDSRSWARNTLHHTSDEILRGIPLDRISRTIEINLLQMLGEKDIPPKVSPINNEYIM